MSTGWFYADSRQGGSVPGTIVGTGSAGEVIVWLDWLLLQGASPWAKATISPNVVTYQAPAGSQITVEVADEYTGAVSHTVRFRAFVGGQQFPTLAQEGSTPLTVQKRILANSGFTIGYYGIRSDRFFALYTYGLSSSNGAASFVAFGDVPVIDPSDPGMCVALGNPRAYPSTAQYSNGSQFTWSASTEVFIGYSYTTKNGLILSPPTYMHTHPWTWGFDQNVLSYEGQMPLFKYLLGTSTNQSATGAPVIRGVLPFLRCPPATTGVTFRPQSSTHLLYGDTVSDGIGTYELIDLTASTSRVAFPLTDNGDMP